MPILITVIYTKLNKKTDVKAHTIILSVKCFMKIHINQPNSIVKYGFMLEQIKIRRQLFLLGVTPLFVPFHFVPFRKIPLASKLVGYLHYSIIQW